MGISHWERTQSTTDCTLCSGDWGRPEGSLQAGGQGAGTVQEERWPEVHIRVFMQSSHLGEALSLTPAIITWPLQRGQTEELRAETPKNEGLSLGRGLGLLLSAPRPGLDCEPKMQCQCARPRRGGLSSNRETKPQLCYLVSTKPFPVLI